MRVLSGIQPTGQLHIGNYLGAIREWVRLQQRENADIYYAVVDLHALTVPQARSEMRRQTLGMLAALVAAGVDPERCALFVQSHVAAHAQLMWLLSTQTSLGTLMRMTQFKDKSAARAREEGGPSLGLLSYPVLQAADVLLYNADLVPVGDDQLQHLELTRDLADALNARLGAELLKRPRALLTRAPRVMSLQDATRKMSKSDPGEGSRINLTDSDDAIAAKVRRARTDAQSGLALELDEAGALTEAAWAARPEACNLVTIFSEFAGQPLARVCDEFRDAPHSAFKQRLVDLLVASLSPLRREVARLEADPAFLAAVARRGAERADAAASATLARVHDALGLVAP